MKMSESDICPICQLNHKPTWASCCEWCWNYIGELDRIEGTDYQKRLKEGKPVVIWQRLIVKHISMFYPLTKEERMLRIKKLSKFCNGCLKDVSTDCSKCWVHWIQNEIMGNGNNGE